MKSLTDPICQLSTDLSTKPDLSTIFREMKNWQIGGCTVSFLIFFLLCSFLDNINISVAVNNATLGYSETELRKKSSTPVDGYLKLTSHDKAISVSGRWRKLHRKTSRQITESLVLTKSRDRLETGWKYYKLYLKLRFFEFSQTP